MAGGATLHGATTLRRYYRRTTLRRYVVTHLFTPPMSQSKASCHESGIDRQRHRPADALTPGTHARTNHGTLQARARGGERVGGVGEVGGVGAHVWRVETQHGAAPELEGRLQAGID